MTDLNPHRIQALVEEAIDDGATTVEEIHRRVAAAPLEVLKDVEGLGDVAGKAEDLTSRSIGAVYNTIRAVNEQVGVLAERLLSKVDDAR